ACLYMLYTSQVCPRPMRRIEKAWLSCSRPNIPMVPGSLDLIRFQSSVISKADFRSGDINGFLPPEPVGPPWQSRRHCLKEEISHKKAQKVFVLFVPFCRPFLFLEGADERTTDSLPQGQIVSMLRN